MRNDLERAERRWRKKSLFRSHQQHRWWHNIGWLLLIALILLVIAALLKPEFLKQGIQWIEQLL